MPPGADMFGAVLTNGAASRLGLHPYRAPTGVNSVPYDGRPACNNCGFCGVVCGSAFCHGGVCADADPCPATGRTNCSSLCADLQTDPNNCGACGIVCPSGQCIDGGCTDVVN